MSYNTVELYFCGYKRAKALYDLGLKLSEHNSLAWYDREGVLRFDDEYFDVEIFVPTIEQAFDFIESKGITINVKPAMFKVDFETQGTTTIAADYVYNVLDFWEGNQFHLDSRDAIDNKYTAKLTALDKAIEFLKKRN